MGKRVWAWTAGSYFAILAATLVDVFISPGPPEPRDRVLQATGNRVAIAPILHAESPYPDEVTLTENGRRTKLVLTGDYVRSRRFLFADINFYEIASYVEQAPVGTTEEMLQSLWLDEGRKVYLLRFLFSVPGWQLRKAVHDEMARSFGDVPIDQHRTEVDQLLGAFANGASAGDVFYLARLPGNRVFLGVRNALDLNHVTDAPPLCQAIWRMWAGPTAEPGRAGLVKKLAPQS